MLLLKSKHKVKLVALPSKKKKTNLVALNAKGLTMVKSHYMMRGFNGHFKQES